MAEKVILGKELLLKVDGVVVGCATSNTFSSEREMVDAACKESGIFFDATPGNITATMSVDGLVKVDNPADPLKVRAWDLMNLHLAGTKIEFEFGSDGSAESIIEGFAYISSMELTGEHEGNAQYSASLQVVGEWTVTVNV